MVNSLVIIFQMMTIRDSKIKTVLAPNRNILDLNKVFFRLKKDMNNEYYKAKNEGVY